MIRFNDFNNRFVDDELYDFEDPAIFENIVLNEMPQFLNPDLNQLIINNDSPTNAIGSSTTAGQVPTDILGVNRTQDPDLGAYQSIPFED